MRLAPFLVLAIALPLGCGGGDSKQPDGKPNGGATKAADGNSSTTNNSQPNGGQPSTNGGSGGSSTSAVPTVELTDEQSTSLSKHLAQIIEPDGKSWKVNRDALEAADQLVGDRYGVLLPLLSDREVEVRRGTAFYLVEIVDPRHPQVVAAFKATLADDDATIRHIGLQAVKKMPREVQIQIVPQLAVLLGGQREDEFQRGDIARFLGSLEVDAAAALPKVLESARGDVQPKDRAASIYAAWKIGSPEQVVPVFAEILISDADPTVRAAAALRLSMLKAAAAPAAQQLAQALEDEDDNVQGTSAKALVAIGGPAVQPVIGQLDSEKPLTRRLAIQVLGQLGGKAKAALPALKLRLEDDDEKVRQFAAAAIRVIQSQ